MAKRRTCRTCIECERRPAVEGLLCDACYQRWHANDAEDVLDVLDVLIGQDAAKTPYRAMREGRGK